MGYLKLRSHHQNRRRRREMVTHWDEDEWHGEILGILRLYRYPRVDEVPTVQWSLMPVVA